MGIGDGRNIDWPVNWQLCFHAQLPLHNRLVGEIQTPCQQDCCLSTNHLIHIPLTREQDHETLKLTLVNNWSLIWNVNCTFFAHGLIFGGADSPHSSFTLSCKLPYWLSQKLIKTGSTATGWFINLTLVIDSGTLNNEGLNWILSSAARKNMIGLKRWWTIFRTVSFHWFYSDCYDLFSTIFNEGIIFVESSRAGWNSTVGKDNVIFFYICFLDHF